ncbi:hypothetical protein BYT27DRAFT_7265004 [Phlegmacium glaucopus]|nr:hypothetical protein BYT27DRAFT_7265004 [Phlegmacium glaucopus]
MADAPKPSVLIFGGLNTCSRALAAFLVPLEGEHLVSYLRIVDKYSVLPPTTFVLSFSFPLLEFFFFNDEPSQTYYSYIGVEFPKVLEKPEVEYRQVNLTVPSNIPATFEPPAGHSKFDYVFDFTGEVRHDRTEMIQINTTFSVARLLGLEAAKRKVKAYVRIQHPFYETPSKGVYDEKEDIKPSGTLGIWWHETLRTLASIEELNLVILRIGFVYGPYTNFGNVASAITVASVYGYVHKPMKYLWAPGKNATNTVHVLDVAGAAWASAKWMASEGRKTANQIAGQAIIFHNDKSKVKEVDGMLPPDAKPIAPLFNLVDDSQSTLLSTGQIISSYFGTTLEFFSLVETTMFKIMDDIEDINEHHVGAWTEMLEKSNPPIHNTPLTAYMDKFTLEKHVVSLDNSKIKQITGYKLLKPELNHENIKEVVDKWKEEAIWPNVD